jgi:Flp pilus assembly protein TadG
MIRESLRGNRPFASRRRGMVIVYVMIVVLSLIGIVSLAVDTGRVVVAKTAMRGAVDAAARAAVMQIQQGSDAAISAAIGVAGENSVDGSPLVLQSSDVTVGNWENGSFTAGGTSPNAVMVQAFRTAARGCPIPLTFGQIVGAPTCDVTAVAIARYTPSQGNIGIVGIDSLTLKGTPETDSYNSNNGPYGGSNIGNYGNIGSNGNVDLQGDPTVNGWAYYGPGASITGVGHADGYATLVAPLAYDSAVSPASNNNASLPASSYVDSSNPPNLTMHGNNAALTLPSGTYLFNNFSATGGTLSVSGQVSIYVQGSFALTGNLVDGQIPSNLQIYVLPSSTAVSFGGTSSLFAQIYAPDTPVTGGGTGDFYGSVIGKTLYLGGTGAVHYDASQGSNANPYIQLVK